MRDSIHITAATNLVGVKATPETIAGIQRMLDLSVLTCEFDWEPNDDDHNATIVNLTGVILWRVSAGRSVPDGHA